MARGEWQSDTHLRRRAKERRRTERRLDAYHEAFAALREHRAEPAAALWRLLTQLAKHGGVERRGVERRAERSAGADDVPISLHSHLMREAIRVYQRQSEAVTRDHGLLTSPTRSPRPRAPAFVHLMRVASCRSSSRLCASL